jgi:hypothetical protein
MKEKRRCVMKISVDGVEIPFREYLVDIGGSGQLYADHIREVLDEWKKSDWAYVDDYIGHIAAQVIIDASEVDRESYNEIMTVVEKVYTNLRTKQLIEWEEADVKHRRESLHVVKNKKSPSDEDDQLT